VTDDPTLGAKRQLRRGSLGLFEAIGQSVANIAPTGTPALSLAVLAGISGAGSWLAYVIATIGMIVVGANIGQLARRHPMAGSYFVYIGRTLGPLAGMVAGWSMVAAYVTAGIASSIAGEVVFANLLQAVGLPAANPPVWVFYLIFMVVVWLLAYRDIRLSSRVGMVLECLSLATMVSITAIVVARHGSVIDPVQLDLIHLERGAIMSGLPLAVFAFVGFESAATLAKETRDPTRSIPRAIMLSGVLAGLFFVAITYSMVLAVGGDAGILAASSAPFAEITDRAGLPWAAALVYGAALVTAFAAALACINAASRLTFSMGRYEFVHRSMGAVHRQHQTPYVAITAASGLIVFACIAMSEIAEPLLGFGLTATFSTFGFLVVYLLISLVAPVDLHRAGRMRLYHIAIGVLGVVLMLFCMVGSVYPVPDYPYNLLPYLFVAYLLVGVFWYAVLSYRSPQALALLHEDLEF
jgi:amino acid transporter